MIRVMMAVVVATTFQTNNRKKRIPTFCERNVVVVVPTSFPPALYSGDSSEEMVNKSNAEPIINTFKMKQ